MRKVIPLLCLLCLPAHTGCWRDGPFSRLFNKPTAAGNVSRADQKRPTDWESSVMAEWDKERQDDKEWQNLRSLNKR
jgi:hypothetical protein